MFDGTGNVVQADPTSPSYEFAGISLGAAAAGSLVSVVSGGQTITEPGWSWTPGAAIYVGAAGALTQSVPTTGWLQQVATAVSATTLAVQPYQPILRS